MATSASGLRLTTNNVPVWCPIQVKDSPNLDVANTLVSSSMRGEGAVSVLEIAWTVAQETEVRRCWGVRPPLGDLGETRGLLFDRRGLSRLTRVIRLVDELEFIACP